MTTRPRLQNTMPKGINAGRLTPQSNQTSTDFPVAIPGLCGSFDLTPTKRTGRYPREAGSNANVFAYAELKNYPSFNWLIKNTNTENEPLYCYLYGSTSQHPAVLNAGNLELVHRVLPNDVINVGVPVRSHYYRTEYRIGSAANVNVVADVRTIPFQLSATDEPLYKDYTQYRNATLTRPGARFDSELVRNRSFGSNLVTIQSRVTEITASVAQLTWDIDETYTRLQTAHTMKVASTSALDDAMVVFIEGVDGSGEYLCETLVLADAITGEMTGEQYWKVNRATVIGGTSSQFFNAGDISIGYDDGVNPLFHQEYIRAGASISTTSKYAVPYGKNVVLRGVRMVGTIDDDTTMAVFKWHSLADTAIRYQLLEFSGLNNVSGTGQEIYYDLNEFLDEQEEVTVVVVNAGSVSTNVFTLGLVFEEYDSAQIVSNPV